MAILPDKKLHSSIWIIISLLYFSIVSCSKIDLPKFISAKNEDAPNDQEKLNNRNDEIELLKKKISEKTFQLSELKKKLNELDPKQKTRITEELSTPKRLQRREELLQLKENEIHAKVEKLEIQSNQFNSYQKEINRDFEKRKQSLDQREREINERARIVGGKFKNSSAIDEDTFLVDKFSQTIAVDKILFNRLPIKNFIKYHDQIVLDGENNLLWSRKNFHQEHKIFPENSKDCLEWADQWRREEYGGINGWRVPSHRELNQLNGLYKYVMGGDSENFKYWGIEKEGNSNLTLFEFSHANFSKNKTSQVSANCRLVANPNSR